ncbi:hypothetical protein FPL11_05620 [Spiribacter aquaticus]|uniref:Uncharacterized protein n=1 Tax=Spiribacter aquaticus TaxID=1935996 RepID=A0A557RK56_9GAMM|nr:MULTISPECIES: hypothetical protein [Spiribacter]KAF0279931.1 hypothetical protein BA897_04125 [Spiribacter roseus]TVO65544.1 hypothetical protein FPL11_05620 [Spiribacter aquaticus]
MSTDGFFWAGMAGGRQNQIDKLNRSIDKWEAHTQKLERIINDLRAENRALRKSRLVWLDNATRREGEGKLIAQSFREVYGTSATEYLGGPDEADKKIEKARIESRKNGIGKNFDWNL